MRIRSRQPLSREKCSRSTWRIFLSRFNGLRELESDLNNHVFLTTDEAIGERTGCSARIELVCGIGAANRALIGGPHIGLEADLITASHAEKRS